MKLAKKTKQTMMSHLFAAGLILISAGLARPAAAASSYQCQTEGFHVDPSDCGRFIRCVDQWQNGRLTPYHFACPAGKLTHSNARNPRYPLID